MGSYVGIIYMELGLMIDFFWNFTPTQKDWDFINIWFWRVKG